MNLPMGTQVQVGSFLPYEETVPVYDIDTHEESYVTTGRLIDITTFTFEGQVVATVSQRVFTQLALLPGASFDRETGSLIVGP